MLTTEGPLVSLMNHRVFMIQNILQVEEGLNIPEICMEPKIIQTDFMTNDSVIIP